LNALGDEGIALGLFSCTHVIDAGGQSFLCGVAAFFLDILCALAGTDLGVRTVAVKKRRNQSEIRQESKSESNRLYQL
jgi:hypothetical protein